MIKNLTTLVLTALAALVLVSGTAYADHHEKVKPPKAEQGDHGNHKGLEKPPEDAKGNDHDGHGDHHDKGKNPKSDGKNR